jgi:DNA helicase-2/ATP-dependent DNA helicase PcrA
LSAGEVRALTVSMRVMSAGDGFRYLLRTVVAGDGDRLLSTPLTRYYSAEGTPPGRWMGRGLAGLASASIVDGSEVTEEQLQRLTAWDAQMPALAAALRAGDGVSLPSGVSEELDVVLSRNWMPLWSAGQNVLPLSFRTIENATDAALNLLLDVATRGRLSTASFGKEGAIARLGLDRDRFLAEQDRLLLPLLADVRAGRSAIDVLDDLREVIKSFDVRRPGRLPDPAKEAQRVAQIEALADRLKHESVIPGLTVFQAKGREWNRVGVVLTRTQEALLAAGLQALDDENCVIYVALTRAKNRCVQIGSDEAIQLEIEEPPGG